MLSQMQVLRRLQGQWNKLQLEGQPNAMLGKDDMAASNKVMKNARNLLHTSIASAYPRSPPINAHSNGYGIDSAHSSAAPPGTSSQYTLSPSPSSTLLHHGHAPMVPHSSRRFSAFGSEGYQASIRLLSHHEGVCRCVCVEGGGGGWFFVLVLCFEPKHKKD
jgi:hypothetical protein